MSVIESMRGLRRAVGFASGGLGSATFEYFTASSEIISISPAPSTRRSTGIALAPCPRETEMNAFLDEGLTARSLIRISRASVPSSAAIFWSIPSMPFVPGVPPAARSPSSRAKITAARLSATNRMPSGPKAIGPTDWSLGPTPDSAGAEAAIGARAARQAMASTALSLSNFVDHIVDSFPILIPPPRQSPAEEESLNSLS